MKLFLKYLLIFILPLLVLAVTEEIVLRKIPNNYSYKKNYLDKHSNEIEVLILGSSHLLYGINPDFIKYRCFNAASSSQSLDLDLAVLKKYEGRWKKLKYIVVPIDYFSLNSNLASGIESWRLKNYKIYYDIDVDINFTQKFEILSNKVKVNLERITNYFFYNKTDISCTKLGWGTQYNSKNNHNLEESGIKAAKRHTANNTLLFNENVIIMNELIEFANNNKSQLILVTTPAYKTYVENLNKIQLNTTLQTIVKIADKNQNVLYFNFLSDPSFIKEDFYDADHFNEIGSKKFSNILNDTLKNIYVKTGMLK